MRLAQALVNRNQNDSAIAVLDKCQEFFPNEKIPYDLYMLAYPEIYYQAGAIEKGDELINKIIDNCLDDLRYYESLDTKFISYYGENIRENLAMINEMSNVAARAKRTELKMQLDNMLNQEFEKFYMHFE